MLVRAVNCFVNDSAESVLMVNLFAGDFSLRENQPVQILDRMVQQQISNLKESYPACVKYGEINVLHTLGDLKIKRIILIGSDKAEAMTADKLRFLFGNAIRVVRKLAVDGIGIYTNLQYTCSYADTVQAIVEGVTFGNYQFDFYKEIKAKKVGRISLLEQNEKLFHTTRYVVEKAKIFTESVIACRDWVNHPSCYVTPEFMANAAIKIGESQRVQVETADRDAIKRLGMQAFLAVAKGSAVAPRLITMKYTGNPASKEVLAYVGKGITFDSGGISLKSSVNMGEMKNDMAGAAAVLAAMQAIGKLQPKINVLAVIPCCENMPSGSAVKPGDVVKSMSGITIEIDNTDAEGRLVLADAITYAITLGATRLVDIATLTGACTIALGNVASGVISNDAGFCHKLLSSAQQNGEKMWQLPSYEEYRTQLKSDIADIKNTGGRMAGTITAGLFIEKFTKGLPWVHIDIAGTANLKRESGIYTKGASGVGTRTLIQLALDMVNKDE